MNRLEVSRQQAIQALYGRGWSQRRIARELDIHRETVARYVHAAKPAIATAGSPPRDDPKRAISTTGSEAVAEANPAISTAGSMAGRFSLCRELLPMIATAVSTGGPSARRIHEDLVWSPRTTSPAVTSR